MRGLFGTYSAAVDGIQRLASLQTGETRVGNSIRVPINVTPAGVPADDFFIAAEQLGLFRRLGETPHGVDDYVWTVDIPTLAAAQNAFGVS